MENSSGNTSSGGGNKEGSNNKRRNNKNRYNKNRNRNRNKKNQVNAKQDGDKPTQKASSNNSGNKKNNNRRRRYNNKKRNNRGPKLTGIDYISTKYLNLLDQHLQARKKYFEMFDRANPNQLAKLEKNFIETGDAFLAFKSRLSEEDKKLFEQRYEAQKPDRTYSSNHGISPVQEVEVAKEDIKDPHYLQTQIEANFSEDTEETMGTMDDYKAYKGL